MYRYDEFDQKLVDQRVEQFRDQVARRLSGELSEEEFRPLRLMNGLYLQLHAYMFRIAIPYGVLSSEKLRKLAYIGDRYDRGYGHFTTRQNIQFNWPALKDVPDMLKELAQVQMHAIQTSGNCIRNTTSDQYAGAAVDEIEDPRIYCEIIRQWSTLHPEFTFLPRKFKIAVTGSENDRAAVRIHDIGLIMKRNDAGEVGFEVLVGGGLGRTPMIGKTVSEFVSKQDLLAYLEAILRVYNMLGRRDNKFKARIKILVHETGIDKVRDLVEEEFAYIRDGALDLPEEEVERIKTYFAPPAYEEFAEPVSAYEEALAADPAFRSWAETNLAEHKVPGYAIVNLSLKPIGEAPGDVTSDQMRAIADLADTYNHSEVVVTHEQNLVMGNVRKQDLHDLWTGLTEQRLATPNIGRISDIICCPGLDFCNLATARSIPVSQAISERFADLKRQNDIGDMKIKISGCINACGHHHVGHIGILGLDKRGEEFYQVTLGGSADSQAAIGEIVGRGFGSGEIVDAVETIVNTYLELRASADESFLKAWRRVGNEPFKEALYAGD